MICAYQLIKNLIKFIDEKEKDIKKPDPIDFFLKSMSDETYLDMIREKIQFLIDEDYKYSEQLKIINRDSARDIKYNTYTTFVKLFILEKPENIFQNREFQRFYSNYNGRDNVQATSKPIVTQQEEEPKTESISDEVANFNIAPKRKTSRRVSKPKTKTEDYSTKKVTVAPLKKKAINSDSREKVGFQHEAMPDVNELY